MLLIQFRIVQQLHYIYLPAITTSDPFDNDAHIPDDLPFPQAVVNLKLFTEVIMWLILISLAQKNYCFLVIINLISEI